MPSQPTRRQFLQAASCLAAAALAPSRLAVAQENREFLLSLSELSLKRLLDSKEIDHLDFVVLAKNEFGITAVEYASPFFAGKEADEKYLDTMNERAADQGVRQLLIRVQDQGQLGDLDAARRQEALVKHRKWIDAAKVLGCHSIVVDAPIEGKADNLRDRTAEGLLALCEYGEKQKINVLVNNRGLTDAAWLMQLIKQVKHSSCGSYLCFDGIAEDAQPNKFSGLIPFTRGVSATASEFDQQGNEKNRDFFQLMNVVLEAGYRGYVGIEYLGKELPEREGISATKALLERVRARRA